MNVCLISEEFPPQTLWGGIGTYTYNLAGGLAALGHRVHVISRTWEKEGVQEMDGVMVHRVAVPDPSWRWGTWYWNIRFPESRALWFWNLAVKRALDGILAHERIDVAEAPEFHAQALIGAMSRRNFPWVIKLHTPAYLCRHLNGTTPAAGATDRFLSEQAERTLACAANLITSPSRCLAEDVSRSWRLPAERVRVVPNPIDETVFRPTDEGTRRGEWVLFVGRLERRKGVEVLADAFAAARRDVPRARIRFVGNDHPSGPGGGSMKAHLIQRFSASGIPTDAFTFSGSLSRDLLPAVYRNAAVCVIPSLYENFPYTCLEAMASGCAVIASRTGGIPEIVSDGVDGLLVPPADPRALGQALTRVLGDEGLRHDLGRAARKTVCARFSRHAVSCRTADLYRRLAGRG